MMVLLLTIITFNANMSITGAILYATMACYVGGNVTIDTNFNGDVTLIRW